MVRVRVRVRGSKAVRFGQDGGDRQMQDCCWRMIIRWRRSRVEGYGKG